MTWRPEAQGALLEFVQIGNRERNLLIRSAEPGRRATVVVRSGGRDLGEHEINPEAVIPLPTDLPLGRVSIQLHIHPPIAVEIPAIKPVRRAGSVDVTTEAISQSPWSVAEIVRRVGHGARLEGTLEPPVSAGNDQRFEVIARRLLRFK